jgi:hypothetical protein
MEFDEMPDYEFIISEMKKLLKYFAGDTKL